VEKKALLTAAFISMFLFSAVAGTQFANLASAQFLGSITINADGTVDPADAPIQRIGNNYILTSDVDRIVVSRSDFVFDGNGYTPSGSSGTMAVYLGSVRNVTVKNLVIIGGHVGIFLDESASNCTIANNTITGTYVPIPEMQATGGIYVWGGGSHTISGNNIADNMGGIYLGYGAEHNIIVNNNITGNTLGGMSIWESSNNTIYRNRFINNTIQVKDVAINSSYWKITSHNTWDNGKEGNFWSDYNGTDANSDGIGDTPYEIDSNNKDRYPLMKPWDPTKPVDTASPLISVFSPQNKVYNNSSVPLTFSTNEPTSRISYSLDNQDNVTITGNTTLSGLPNGSHNLTVYVTDQFGNTGASEIIYFSVDVPEPFPTALVAASIASVAIIGAGLVLYFTKIKKTSKKTK
jgi:parallel beta-helix repeat protein